MTVTDYATLGLAGCCLVLIAAVSDWWDSAYQRANQ